MLPIVVLESAPITTPPSKATAIIDVPKFTSPFLSLLASACVIALLKSILLSWASCLRADDITRGADVAGNLNRVKLIISNPLSSFDDKQTDLVVEILEMGAFNAIDKKDISSFQRYLTLLNPFYTKKTTQNYEKLLSLQLLIYLTQNKLSDFHSLLESLPLEYLNNQHLQSPISLERWIMEGSYNKIWESKSTIESFSTWIWSDLIDTIRNEIASCQEKAYDSLPMNDAATLLFFTNQSELSQFANKRGWTISPSTQHVIFKDLNSITGIEKAKIQLPSRNMISHSLNYAKELESIV
ncbi:hypothetical protein E3P99_03801 [Wallemia hederae]|uniref:PCI domain-containing protein n=1 Tax=Wallemia hederae TaxID=1540922 RepID=A0A4T0FFS0_9BASI|nr:hypothetical protein E3P99_03801 [Wallemia hederae]